MATPDRERVPELADAGSRVQGNIRQRERGTRGRFGLGVTRSLQHARDLEPPVPQITRTRDMVAMHVVAVVLAMLVSSTALAERWYIVSSGTFGAQTAVDLDSIAPVPGYPERISVLVYVHNGINTFGCSPPLNCIATSQLTYYYVDCRSLQAAEIRRIPMDLREKVIAVVEAAQVTWFPLIRRYIDRDADSEGGSRVRAEIDERHRELLGFCGLYNAGKLSAMLTTDGRR